jgi:DNA replication protein DnaC
MAESDIPVDYWMRHMGDWHGDPRFGEWMREYTSDLERLFARGRVLCLTGHRGVGKTMAACGMLKAALRQGFTAHYTTLVEVIEQLISRDTAPSYRRLLKMTDFLAIDEVDQRFFESPGSRSLYGNHFENVMRLRTQNRLPLVICTNSEDLDQIFAGEFQKSFASLRAQFMDIRRIGGKDARRKES